MAGPGPKSRAVCQQPSGNPNPQGLQEMDVTTLAQMNMAKRAAWYQKMLLPYRAEVRQSAGCNGIPSQLLATVILNELADINWTDVWQQRLGLMGSLGIAQIQVSTAEANALVEYPGDQQRIKRQARQAGQLCQQFSAGPFGRGGCLSPSQYEGILKRQMVRRRLTIPQYAVEAAAREIRRLLDQACGDNTKPWVRRFSFSLTSMSSLSRAQDIYNHIAGSGQLAKEQNLAEMVVAAYNSPQILIARKQASITQGHPKQVYRNGMIHGSNSRFIAEDLYRIRTFH